MIRVVLLVDGLPDDFAAVMREAAAEGYRMLDRLATEWASGAHRFTRPGEALLAAYSHDVLAGIGGLTVEPAIAGAFRMRRFYVRPGYRRVGVARRLALALLDRLPRSGQTITVNAAGGSEPFWEALGFARVQGAGWTHSLILHLR